ncbi:MAG: 50S ribosomal protein L25 [Dehalococcoidia bacterium]|nr:50S ribosomal protein L25 [Dehalococcoidia bacterium]
MADRATLHAERRTVLGKKVRRLRSEGILPANIYGRNLESVAIQVETRAFLQSVKQAGVRSMFEVAVAGESEPRYVIIRGIDRPGGHGDPLHIDFYQVDLRRPVQTNVQLITEGEAPAVVDLAGTLLQNLEYVTVECLPLDIPSSIAVDLSSLENFDVSITVGDLVAPQGVTIITDPSVSVATVAQPRIRLEGEEEEGDEFGEGEEGVEGEESAEGDDASGEASED